MFERFKQIGSFVEAIKAEHCNVADPPEKIASLRSRGVLEFANQQVHLWSQDGDLTTAPIEGTWIAMDEFEQIFLLSNDAIEDHFYPW